jgi:hypothetical protein
MIFGWEWISNCEGCEESKAGDERELHFENVKGIKRECLSDGD